MSNTDDSRRDPYEPPPDPPPEPDMVDEPWTVEFQAAWRGGVAHSVRATVRWNARTGESQEVVVAYDNLPLNFHYNHQIVWAPTNMEVLPDPMQRPVADALKAYAGWARVGAAEVYEWRDLPEEQQRLDPEVLRKLKRERQSPGPEEDE